jgi:hypothetical protein
MKCVYIDEAKYISGHVVFLRFNDGLCGNVDLNEKINEYKIADTLKDPVEFSKFYLDAWPTLAWECGFDIAPESLYQMCEQSAAPNSSPLRGQA